MVEGMLASIEAGETFIVWDDDHTPAATITINRFAKPELWTPQEAAEPALYAHKVTVDRAYGGQGLGAELLDWAGTKAADEGADWLWVDVWTANERLQHYYLRRGFTYVRTVVLLHNPSGALFQRPAQRVPTSRLQEVQSLTGRPDRMRTCLHPVAHESSRVVNPRPGESSVLCTWAGICCSTAIASTCCATASPRHRST
jgi:hypothetical protein